MSLPNLKAALASSPIGKSLKPGDASATPAKSAPSFSRSQPDGQLLPKLSSACAVNGVIPNYSFLEEAAVGDLMRTVRDVQKGDVPKAKERLAEMSHYDLGEFFKKNNIHPMLLGELSKAMDSSTDPKKVLTAVFGVLRNLGASELSSRLRPAKEG